MVKVEAGKGILMQMAAIMTTQGATEVGTLLLPVMRFDPGIFRYLQAPRLQTKA